MLPQDIKQIFDINEIKDNRNVYKIVPHQIRNKSKTGAEAIETLSIFRLIILVLPRRIVY